MSFFQSIRHNQKSVKLAICQFHDLRLSHCLDIETDNAKPTPNIF